MESIAGIGASIGLAYALGGFPTGLVLGRWLFGIDVREHGSGNIGSTNVLRTLGWQWGLVVQAVDVLKGVLAVTLLPALLAPNPAFGLERLHVQVLTGIAAVAGHCWSPWAGFRGGKGVNTAAGVLGVLAPVELAVGLGAFIVFLAASGYVSAGSLAAAVAVPIAVAARLGWEPAVSSPLFWGAVAIAGIVILRHRPNIERILKGSEYRFDAVWLLGRWQQRQRSK
ncbi:MAG: glycerol-3-phosphate 1-O-acyltransferase PlsY [Candidatus Kapabacteria bacterium]|nr:glycerol-3-phosphate 1-O-acyltransferase PlsY [Candidatus Kapabacteria bacterium]MDW8012652.1 glycerol-3-phosphate 1-O-acyltransferase PlsY [Bacteroidota bacterium]